MKSHFERQGEPYRDGRWEAFAELLGGDAFLGSRAYRAWFINGPKRPARPGEGALHEEWTTSAGTTRRIILWVADDRGIIKRQFVSTRFIDRRGFTTDGVAPEP